jgi:hypothetical protein
MGLPSSWDMSDWLGTTPEESEKLVKDFNHNDWRFGALPPTANSQVFLPALHKRGARIAAITCCSHNESAIALRKANLFHVFGDIFETVICQPLGTSKLSNLSLFKNEKVLAWVEDKPSAAIEGHNLGFTSYLINQSHNLQAELPQGIKRTDGWEIIANDIWDQI